MELSRRDAIAALAAVGIGTGGVALYRSDAFGDGSIDSETSPDDPVDTMIALAAVVYPSEVSGIDEFVETYVVGRLEDDETHEERTVQALAHLEGYASDEFGDSFVDLSPEDRDAVLRELGVQNAQPNPEGSDVERIRYYLVNELLYALFTSPTGGELVGHENPPGHGGGLDSYRRGPDA
ncbi:gluconate 2-dehydrogenase subunit 3 family protein [Natronoglomus mannanivorans]|uniref:Gluconate 2-dehydrogenase subunit 3 family protein n=1 Tax=Natronoglomus mannanivorans TaxID=2979990 RepID=A0AAP2Z0D7_9EURY|nr:gluconate 2-dehydrogenase subunit 3 family protein [Halobacteria archaeon AArc-xg1-1]